LIEADVKLFNSLITRNGGRSLINYFIKIIGFIYSHLTKSNVTLICYFAFWLHRLVKHNGTKGAVIKLKACQVLLMQSVASYRIHDISELKVRVNRTKGGGIPRVIPRLERIRIRKRDVACIRFWMTLFGVYRIMSFPSEIKYSTITDPSTSRLDLRE